MISVYLFDDKRHTVSSPSVMPLPKGADFDFARDLLGSGHVVVNKYEPRYECKTGLIEALEVTSLNQLRNELSYLLGLKSWGKALLLNLSEEELDSDDFDLSFLKGTMIDWALAPKAHPNLVGQIWRTGLRFWAPDYHLAHQEIPEKVLIYLNSR